jgi:hypothetical protein
MKLIIGAVFGAALAVALLAFDFGGDCGDTIRDDGSEAFACSGIAYAAMAVGFIALMGLFGVLLWAAIDWFRASRAR